MSQRRDFCELALKGTLPFSALCLRFGISRKTGYKWLERYRHAPGAVSLEDRSRKPLSSPGRLGPDLEAHILSLRQQHPVWGCRKLRVLLQRQAIAPLPSTSTINATLKRHGLLLPRKDPVGVAYQRFEAPHANALWQMDFKGPLALRQGQCHAFTVLDDHSRYNLALAACSNQTTLTVQKALTTLFRCYGLPERLLSDNGSPWCGGPAHPFSLLSVWLIRLGIGLSHGRPYHPQTQGKEERFHRTLEVEVLRGRTFRERTELQRAFDTWREVYNHVRPHQSIEDKVPASRYTPSLRRFPEVLPPIEYGSQDIVRTVHHSGMVKYKGREFRLSACLAGMRVALRYTTNEGEMDIYFCHQKLKRWKLADSPRYRPRHRPSKPNRSP